jgi:hypothetical protein
MTQAASERRGHGADSIYWDESKNRFVGAVSVGFSPSGTRVRKKVTGRTKAEVRDKLRELHKQVEGGCGRDGGTQWGTRWRTGWRMAWTGCRAHRHLTFGLRGSIHTCAQTAHEHIMYRSI